MGETKANIYDLFDKITNGSITKPNATHMSRSEVEHLVSPGGGRGGRGGGGGTAEEVGVVVGRTTRRFELEQDTHTDTYDTSGGIYQPKTRKTGNPSPLGNSHNRDGDYDLAPEGGLGVGWVGWEQVTNTNTNNT